MGLVDEDGVADPRLSSRGTAVEGPGTEGTGTIGISGLCDGAASISAPICRELG